MANEEKKHSYGVSLLKRGGPGNQMSSHESDRVLTLLKELSLLKELDRGYEAGSKSEAERTDHEVRQKRHGEIAQEIKAIAEVRKSDTDPA